MVGGRLRDGLRLVALRPGEGPRCWSGWIIWIDKFGSGDHGPDFTLFAKLDSGGEVGWKLDGNGGPSRQSSSPQHTGYRPHACSYVVHAPRLLSGDRVTTDVPARFPPARRAAGSARKRESFDGVHMEWTAETGDPAWAEQGCSLLSILVGRVKRRRRRRNLTNPSKYLSLALASLSCASSWEGKAADSPESTGRSGVLAPFDYAYHWEGYYSPLIRNWTWARS